MVKIMIHTDYDTLIAQAEALTDGVPHFVANMANISALIFETLEEINWAGFYLRKGDKLVLGPFQGKTACIEIPFGKGVCGTAFAENRTVLVEDVHCFEGHIACDSASNSEIVVPIHRCVDISTPDEQGEGCDNASATSDGQEKESNAGTCNPDGQKNTEVVAVLDIDSTSLSRFTREDAEGLERLVKVLEEKVFKEADISV
ncbi:MAG: GAF domain-containing protein [Lachnospiraceae bacterium]|nr:GAF domain-containing protein [Lachnospiraceae bacterium]